MTLILFIIILAILILAHEIGHFITAKWGGIRVDEFGLGLPPRLFGWKKGETIYSLNWLPFGGFVKIFGEDPTEEDICGPDKHRCFVNRPKWIQAIVLSAGVFFNLVLAWMLLSVNLLIGMPASIEGLPKNLTINNEMTAIVNVLKDSPADQAGLKTGDQLTLLSAGGEKISDLSPAAVQDFIKKFPGQAIHVEYLRKTKTTIITEVIPQRGINGGSDPAIGIAMDKIGVVSASWWQAPFYGLYFVYHLTINTFLAFSHFFSGLFTNGRSALGAIAGPIGIYSLVNDASRLGLVYIFNFIALISVNLAILNFLPFPALDGGRLLFVGIEAITRRPIKPKIANALNLVGFVLLIALMIVIAVSDVLKLL